MNMPNCAQGCLCGSYLEDQTDSSKLCLPNGWNEQAIVHLRFSRTVLLQSVRFLNERTAFLNLNLSEKCKCLHRVHILIFINQQLEKCFMLFLQCIMQSVTVRPSAVYL